MFKSEHACDVHVQRFCPLKLQHSIAGPSAGGGSPSPSSGAPATALVLASGDVAAPCADLELGGGGALGLDASLEHLLDNVIDSQKEHVPDVGDLDEFMNGDSSDFASFLASL